MKLLFFLSFYLCRKVNIVSKTYPDKSLTIFAQGTVRLVNDADLQNFSTKKSVFEEADNKIVKNDEKLNLCKKNRDPGIVGCNNSKLSDADPDTAWQIVDGPDGSVKLKTSNNLCLTDKGGTYGTAPGSPLNAATCSESQEQLFKLVFLDGNVTTPIVSLPYIKDSSKHGRKKIYVSDPSHSTHHKHHKDTVELHIASGGQK